MRNVVEMESGSLVYGTNLPTSDKDFKAVAIPNVRDIILRKAFKTVTLTTGDDKSKNTAEDVDHETFALDQYLRLVTEGQTMALDMLFTPRQHLLKTSPLWEEILANKDKLVSKKMTAFAGYCKGQAAKYSLKGDHMSAYENAKEWFRYLPSHMRVSDALIPRLCEKEPLAQIVNIPHKITGQDEYYLQVGPKTKVPFTATVKTAFEIYNEQFNKYGARAKSAMENHGVDWKALYHAVRIAREGIELCTYGTITFPRPEVDLLLQIRKGELKYEQVARMIDDDLEALTIAKENSTLPDEPDIEWIENLIYREYTKGL